MITFNEWAAEQESFGCARDVREAYGDWLMAPCMRTRDSDCLGESNFVSCLEILGGEGDTVAVLRFGHWAVGWTEWIVAAPEHAATLAEIERRLESYPVLDEFDFSKREQAEANRVWADCYSSQERIDYMRKNRDQFHFYDFRDMLACARGRYFSGYASELIY